MNQPQQEHKFKVSNPERIVRILQKLCHAGLPVMLRPPGIGAVAIRAKASDLYSDQVVNGIRIGAISDKGMSMLAGHSKIQVEFVMMSTKVVFHTLLLRREPNAILCQIPLALVSIERRKNTRFPVTAEMMGFITLGIWKANEQDLLAPPAFEHHPELASSIALADISSNGLCGVFRFPSLQATVKSGQIDEDALLHLPMAEPFNIPLEVRWIKKIKETMTSPDGSPRVTRSYRFGVEFRSPSETVILRIKHFIHQLTQQGAV